jgi:hypothetical protein
MSGVIYPINDKKYTAEDVEIFNCTRTSGVYSVLDFDYSLSGNVLTVGKGLAWIKNGDFSGKAIAFKDVTTITLDSADDTLDRYDVIAVRYDATKTEPEIVVIKGTASETPTIPTRNTQSYLYELFLCSILRKAGEETATTSNITDLRESDYCGIMRDSVTSATAPVYETIYSGSGLAVGKTLTFDYSKYAFVIATVYNSSIKVSCDVVLTTATPFAGIQTALSGSNFVMNTSGVSRGDIFFRAQIVIGSEGSTVDVCEYSNTSDFADVSGKACVITKLIGVTKQPEGYVKVDSVYNPESHNAQSGEAVKQAIDEALAEFEPPESDVDFLGNLRPVLKAFFTNVQTLITQIAYTQDENIGSELIQNASDIVSVLEIAPPDEPEEPDEPETPEEPEEPEIDENAVNIYTGFLGMDSTVNSEPVTNDQYPNAVCSDLIPVNYEGGGSWEYDIKLNSNISDTSKINWKSYILETGVRHRSVGGDTITGVANIYGVRLNILDQTATADGSNAVITGFTVTVRIGSTVKDVYEIGINDLRG